MVWGFEDEQKELKHPVDLRQGFQELKNDAQQLSELSQ